MQENIYTVQDLLNIKTPVLIAGLLGALITMLRKTQGSLQARIFGYGIATISVLYLVPFLLWFIEFKFGLALHSSVENMLSFVCGIFSQTIVENFADDPVDSLYKWAANFKRLKRVIWNGEIKEVSISPDKQPTEVETK